MKKFSYQKEFNRHADVVRFGNADDVKINYGVFVGEPNTDGNNPKEFLGGEFIESPSFTTWQDAQNAKTFAECVLLVVDKHAQKNNAVLEVTNDELYRRMKYSVLDEVSKAFNACTTEENNPNPYSMYAVIVHAINKTFNYYISQGDSATA